jgi:cytochrome P450
MSLPVSDLDIFADDVLLEPYEAYGELRQAGPVVLLRKYDVAAVTSFTAVREALRDWRTFSSTEGIGFNDAMNAPVPGNIVYMEPPEHTDARKAMVGRLGLGKVRDAIPAADKRADQLVTAFLAKGTFDAVRDLAEVFVPNVAGYLLGIGDEMMDRFVAFSTAAFNAAGPDNPRSAEGFATLQEVSEFAATLTKHDMRPGSVGWDILEAAEQGEIPAAMRPFLVLNFMGAAFDTTINGIGNLVWLLATNPDQWEILRDTQSLAESAVNEALRIETPLQVWGRFCHEDALLENVAIPGGTRVAMLLGSAGRDHGHYSDADRFDVRRNPADHLAFGNGIHRCVGAPLATIEIVSVLRAFIRNVRTIDLAAAPVRRLNNTTRGFEQLLVSVS